MTPLDVLNKESIMTSHAQQALQEQLGEPLFPVWLPSDKPPVPEENELIRAGIITLPEDATEEERLAALGVDLAKYIALSHRKTYEPVESTINRSLFNPIARSFVAKAKSRVPDPVMLTHIVTSRCNYSCGFCSFADSLNVKSNELTLAEVESTYATIGGSLNTIVYSGGETTVNRQLADIIEAAYRLTPVKSVYIISNAWKPDLIFEITHRIMQRCPELHLTWSLSIEGPRPHNNAVRYNQIEGWDAWQNTVDTAEGLKKMRELFGYKQLDVQMCTVCTPSNVDLLDDWYVMIRDVLRPDKWNLNLMRRSVQMSQSSLPEFSERRQKGELQPFEQKYIEITERLHRDVMAGRLRFRYNTHNKKEGGMKSAVDLISQEGNRRVVMEEPLPFCCKAGSLGAFIGSQGEVGGCEEFTMNPLENKGFGNLRDVNYDFQALWHSAQADEHRAVVGSARECHGCTLESQKNYPAILVTFKTLVNAWNLANQIG